MTRSGNRYAFLFSLVVVLSLSSFDWLWGQG